MTAENIATIVKCGVFAVKVVLAVGLVCAIAVPVLMIAASMRLCDDTWERELGGDER